MSAITKEQSTRGRGMKPSARPKRTGATAAGKAAQRRAAKVDADDRQRAVARAAKGAAKAAKPAKAEKPACPPVTGIGHARELVADGYILSGVRQTGGTFLVKGESKFELPKPVKPLKRQIAVLVTAAKAKAAKTEAKEAAKEGDA